MNYLRNWRRRFHTTVQTRSNVRPVIERLEDRLAPAYDLAISTGLTNAAVTVSTVGGVTTFLANASGGNVNVADMQSELLAGRDVVVDTGISASAENGDLTWQIAADLDFHGINGTRTLTLRTEPSANVGNIILNAIIQDSAPGVNDRFNLTISSGPAGGSIDMSGGKVYFATDFTATANGTIRFPELVAEGAVTATAGSSIAIAASSKGPVTLTAPTIELGGFVATYNAPVTLNGNVVLLSGTAVSTKQEIDTFGQGADIIINGTIEGTFLDDIALFAGPAGTIFLNGNVGSGGQITDFDVGPSGAIVLAADIFLTGSGAREITFDHTDVITVGNRSIVMTLSGGSFSRVDFLGGRVALGGDLNINFSFLNNSVVLSQGAVLDIGTHSFSADGDLEIGDSIFFTPGTLVGGGLIDLIGSGNDVLVGDNGRIETRGNLAISANTQFLAGGVLDLDLSGVPDQVNVIGSLTIDPDARLEGNGILPSAGPHTLISTTLPMTGAFLGTSSAFVLGADAVDPTYSANSLAVTQVAAGLSTVRRLSDAGAIYTVKLTGGGAAQLVVLDDPSISGIEGVVVRNATLNNVLSITVASNGASPVIDLAGLGVGGSIKAISAVSTNLTGSSQVTGYLKSLKVRDLVDRDLTIGGNAGQLTSIVGRVFTGDLSLGSKLSVLLNDYLDGQITAPSIGSLITRSKAAENLGGDFHAGLLLDAGSRTAMALASANIAGDVRGDLFEVAWDIRGKIGSVIIQGDVVGWQVGNGPRHFDELGGLTSLTIAGAVNVDGPLDTNVIRINGRLTGAKLGRWNGAILAKSIGSLLLVGNASKGLAGDFSGLLSVTGFVNPGKVGIRKFVAAGQVDGSVIRVLTGNVTSFVVGRFLNSQLYVAAAQSPSGITNPDSFTANRKIGTFRTTAQPLNPPTPDAGIDVFANSVVIASRVGTVRLSAITVDNLGTPFGFRVDNVAGNVGSFRIATLPFDMDVNYLPSASGAVTPGVGGQMDFGFYL